MATTSSTITHCPTTRYFLKTHEDKTAEVKQKKFKKIADEINESLRKSNRAWVVVFVDCHLEDQNDAIESTKVFIDEGDKKFKIRVCGQFRHNETLINIDNHIKTCDSEFLPKSQLLTEKYLEEVFKILSNIKIRYDVFLVKSIGHLAYRGFNV